MIHGLKIIWYETRSHAQLSYLASWNMYLFENGPVSRPELLAILWIVN